MGNKKKRGCFGTLLLLYFRLILVGIIAFAIIMATRVFVYLLPIIKAFFIVLLIVILISLALNIYEGINRHSQNARSETSDNLLCKKEMTEYELERFMVECNAILEHEDEMSQYNTSTREDTSTTDVF